MLLIAHGISVRTDLPVPEWLFWPWLVVLVCAAWPPLSSPPPLATATTIATTATTAAATSSPMRWFLDMAAAKYA